MKKIIDVVNNKKELVGLFIILLPILIYWIYWTVNSSYWFNADPSAVYFLDSLGFFAGKSYVFVDHPGTPMQIIGTILLAMTYPLFENREAFLQFFLREPETFFLMTNIFLLATNLFTATLFYKTIASSLTQNRVIGGMALTLLFYTLHPNSFETLTYWSHNSLNFPVGTLVLILLFREMQSSEEIEPYKLVLLGVASGILAIAQVYFWAWLAAGIFTVSLFSTRVNNNLKSGIKSGTYMLLGGIIGITSMLLPVYREIPRFIVWITSVTTHLGLYGGGESGIYSSSLIFLGLAFWWANIRMMVILLAASLLAIGIFAYWNKNNNIKISAGTFAMTAGLILHVVLILLFMAKSALKLKYSLSLASVLPMLIILTLKILEGTPWRTKSLLNIFYLLILLGVTISLVNQKEFIDKRAFQERDSQPAITKAANRLATELDVNIEDLVIVYAYAVPQKCAGLLQSDNWTGHFTEELSRICPNQYTIWDADLVLSTPKPVREITDIDWDLVVWPGNGTNLPDYLYSIGATTIPSTWHIPRSKWFFIHSEILKK